MKFVTTTYYLPLETLQQERMERVVKSIANLNETQLSTGFDPNRQSWKIGKSEKYHSFWLTIKSYFHLILLVL